MHIVITLVPINRKSSLPINYNYFLTGLIYRTIEKSSKDFAQFLHSDGYRIDTSKKGFKLFTYSRLLYEEYSIRGEIITFEQNHIDWRISSPVQEFIEHLVNGVFMEGQEVNIGPESRNTMFIIEKLMSLPSPTFKESMRFLCLSPITISKTINRSSRLNGSSCSNGLNGLNSLNRLNSSCHYIRPWEEGFSDAIKENLIKKYRLVYGETIKSPEFEIKVDTDYLNKRSGKIIKKINFKGTDIIGWEAPFVANGNPKLLEIGYEAGFGEKGSMGFGMVKETVQAAQTV